MDSALQPNPNSDLRRDLDRLYDLLRELETRLGGTRCLRDCHGRMDWPQRGVYFFLEPGEVRGGGSGRSRVVRVGTHALKRGASSRLWGRLRNHRGHGRPGDVGSGHHRHSIFRHHVGLALVAARGGFPGPAVESWPRSKVSREVRLRERPLELAVSEHIGAMPLLWLAVEDPPGPESDRGRIESNVIALLSAGAACDPPSRGWLGRFAQREPIRESGLWNVNHVGESYDPAVLDLLESRLP